MVLLTLMIYPTFFRYFDGVEAPLKTHPWGHWLFAVSLFVLATCSASTFFVFGQKELFGKQAGWKTLLLPAVPDGLGVGVGLNNAKAVFEAIWSAITQEAAASSSARPSTA